VVVEPTAVPEAMCNEGELVQVLANLIVNAAQACARTPASGSGLVHLYPSDAGAFVCVKVSDDGPGFTDEFLQRAFLPFNTTRAAEGGTGLGLSICKRLVESYGGQVHIVSPVAVGAQVEILLPKVAP
jgi:two-component system, sporulation sensor kinase D